MLNLKIQLFGGRGAKSKIGIGGPGMGVPILQHNTSQNENESEEDEQAELDELNVANKSKSESKYITEVELKHLMSVANQNEPSITNDLKQITSKMSGTIDYDIGDGKTSLDYRIKTENSLERKINSDLKEKSKDEVLQSIYDVVRYTYLVNENNFVSDYNEIISELESKGYTVKRVKNTFIDEDAEYKGLNLVIENPEGYKFELQFHTPESLSIKEINHKLYEERRLDSTSPERKLELKNKMKNNVLKIKHIPNINEIKNMNELINIVNNTQIAETQTITISVNDSHNLNSSSGGIESNNMITTNNQPRNIMDVNDNVVVNHQEESSRYYYIDEKLAKSGHSSYSMYSYEENSTTNSYRQKVDQVYAIAQEAISKCEGDLEKKNKILKKVDLYARQYAEWVNKDSQLHIKYPSQLITGPGGWTPSKLEKRDKAYEQHYHKLDEIDKIIDEIKRIPISVKRHETQGVAINTDRLKSNHFEVIQNEETNRLQLRFNEKPDEKTRELLKKNGFKWSPSNSVWQRQLTPNARFAVKVLDEKITKLKNDNKNE